MSNLDIFLTFLPIPLFITLSYFEVNEYIAIGLFFVVIMSLWAWFHREMPGD